MAYQTGSATDVTDLINKLQTFLGSNGWTVDEYDGSTNYRCSVHRDNIYVHFKWESGSPTYVALYHSLGYVVSNDPWAHTNDSGVSDSSSPYNGARHVNFETGSSFTAYHFFVSTSDPRYCHVVVEPASGRFRHFGFGILNKCNDWTGGEYCYGDYWDQNAAQIDTPIGQHSFMIDGVVSGSTRSATLHAESLPQQGGSEKWLVATQTSPTSGTDGDGQTRRSFVGTTRGGLWTYQLSWIRNSELNLYVPLIPIICVFRDLSTSPDTYYILGEQPDVAIVNIANFSPGDEITIGSDTWKLFPWARKQYLLNDTEESWNAGVAYKKIT